MSTLLGDYSASDTIGKMEVLGEQPPKRASHQPTAEDAAKGKALINFLMQDRLFLALLRSTDPKVRAGAINKLNEAHHQAYGGVNAAGSVPTSK